MPHMREELHKPENDEVTREDSTRGDPRVANMRWVRQEIPDQIGAKGTSEDKLRRRKELERKIGMHREKQGPGLLFFS